MKLFRLKFSLYKVWRPVTDRQYGYPYYTGLDQYLELRRELFFLKFKIFAYVVERERSGSDNRLYRKYATLRTLGQTIDSEK